MIEDEAALGAVADSYVHCHRMLGSFDDAEDLVQETMLRAWQSRATFEGRSSFMTLAARAATQRENERHGWSRHRGPGA